MSDQNADINNPGPHDETVDDTAAERVASTTNPGPDVRADDPAASGEADITNPGSEAERDAAAEREAERVADITNPGVSS